MIVINPVIRNRQRPIRALLFVSLAVALAYTFVNRILWTSVLASTRNEAIAGVALADTSRGSLSLLTYNIAGLPEFICSASTPRAPSIAQIGQMIAPYDIVHVQEDFNYNHQLYAGVGSHSFRTKHNGIVPFGDGLSILSKYPIIESRRIAWRNCSGTDCLTPKGFMFTRVQLAKHVIVDFYNLHATAEKNARAAYARQKNLQQLSQFIQEQSKENALVVMGDFNAHYTYMDDDMQRFVLETSLADAWVELIKNGIVPEKTTQHQWLPNLSIDEQAESLDKILFRGNHQVSLIPIAYHVETGKFVDRYGNELSDHLPISVIFDWNVEKKVEDELRPIPAISPHYRKP